MSEDFPLLDDFVGMSNRTPNFKEAVCRACPIRGTRYCHMSNFNAPRYTRKEKVAQVC